MHHGVSLQKPSELSGGQYPKNPVVWTLNYTLHYTLKPYNALAKFRIDPDDVPLFPDWLWGASRALRLQL